jgi:O-antigen/teichoic acid export membrane protein
MTASSDSSVSLPATTAKHNATKQHIRGSSLLLSGRFISLAVNFAIQIVTVRALAKADYGALAYALAVVSFGSTLVVFGMDKTISRFVPIYQEHKDYDRMFGAILMMIGSVIVLGAGLVLLTAMFADLINAQVVKDPHVTALIVILISLSPLQAMDSLLGSMLTIFSGPKAVFLRRFLLNPGLKLAVVLGVWFVHGDATMMALGYLLAAVLGIIVYAIVLWSVMRKEGLFEYFSWRTIKFPFREIFGFSAPLLTTDLVFMLRTFMVVAILQYFYSSTDVAAFRAVLPVAGLNMLVYETFTFLYMPAASRLFARNEFSGISDLYWQSATWIAIASFPVFAITFSLSQSLTLMLFGERYAEAGILLAVLSLGFYVNAALGFNAFTLRVYGRVRAIVFIDILAVISSLIMCMLLIPRYGALGAAIAASSTLILHNILNQAGLGLTTNIAVFDWHYLRTYLSIIVGSAVLLIVQAIAAPPVFVSFVLAGIVSLVLVYVNRGVLDVAQTFPELLRLPFMRHLLAQPKPPLAVEE